MDGSSFTVSAPPVEGLRGSTIAKPQKAFAVAFAVLATALAGCASGLGVNTYDRSAIGGAILGGVLGNAVGNSATAQTGHAYTIRLRSGELVSVAQAGDYAIPNGTPVLIEYGERARVIPQNSSIGYY